MTESITSLSLTPKEQDALRQIIFSRICKLIFLVSTGRKALYPKLSSQIDQALTENKRAERKAIREKTYMQDITNILENEFKSEDEKSLWLTIPTSKDKRNIYKKAVFSLMQDFLQWELVDLQNIFNLTIQNNPQLAQDFSLYDLLEGDHALHFATLANSTKNHLKKHWKNIADFKNEGMTILRNLRLFYLSMTFKSIFEAIFLLSVSNQKKYNPIFYSWEAFNSVYFLCSCQKVFVFLYQRIELDQLKKYAFISVSISAPLIFISLMLQKLINLTSSHSSWATVVFPIFFFQTCAYVTLRLFTSLTNSFLRQLAFFGQRQPLSSDETKGLFLDDLLGLIHGKLTSVKLPPQLVKSTSDHPPLEPSEDTEENAKKTIIDCLVPAKKRIQAENDHRKPKRWHLRGDAQDKTVHHPDIMHEQEPTISHMSQIPLSIPLQHLINNRELNKNTAPCKEILVRIGQTKDFILFNKKIIDWMKEHQLPLEGKGKVIIDTVIQRGYQPGGTGVRRIHHEKGAQKFNLSVKIAHALLGKDRPAFEEADEDQTLKIRQAAIPPIQSEQCGTIHLYKTKLGH